MDEEYFPELEEASPWEMSASPYKRKYNLAKSPCSRKLLGYYSYLMDILAVTYNFADEREDYRRNTLVLWENDGFPTLDFAKHIPNKLHPEFYKKNRGMFLGEMYFLTRVTVPDEDYTVIYIDIDKLNKNKSPSNVNLLSEFFPNCKFLVYSNKDFLSTEKIIDKGLRVNFREVEGISKNGNVKLIMNINSYSYNTTYFDFQKSLVDIPNVDVLTNLFFPETKYESFKGEILLDPWRKPFTIDHDISFSKMKEKVWNAYAESNFPRVMFLWSERQTYDMNEILSKLYYFDKVYRHSSFYFIDPYFGRNYDSLAESVILFMYIKKYLVYEYKHHDYMIMRIIEILDCNFSSEGKVFPYIVEGYPMIHPFDYSKILKKFAEYNKTHPPNILLYGSFLANYDGEY